MSFRKLQTPLVLAFAAVILWLWFFPIANYFYDDEWFVLPERVWFEDPLAWLGHLLFFNQTRFTWVGDQYLHRPGLFIVMWVQDVLFRSERVQQQIFLLAIAVLSYGSLARSFKPHLGRSGGILVALYAFASLSGYYLVTWPHLSGYVIAMGLYAWAVEDFFCKNWFRAAVIFAAATTFHEFVALSLGMGLSLLSLQAALQWYRRESTTQFRPRFFTLFFPLVIYTSLIAVARSLWEHPSSSRRVLDNLISLNPTLVLEKLVEVIWIFINNFLPFAYESWAPDWMRLSAILLILAVVLIWRSKKMKGHTDLTKAAFFAFPLVTMLVGLMLMRVASGDAIKAHYFPMFHFFLTATLMTVVAPFLVDRPKLGKLMAVIAISSIGFGVQQVIGENQRNSNAPELIHQIVQGVKAQLTKEPKSCFAGFRDWQFRPQINEAVQLALQGYSCRRQSESQMLPLWLSLNPDGEVQRFEPPQAKPVAIAILANDSKLESPEPSEELKSYLPNQGDTFLSYQQHLPHEGLITIQRLKANLATSELSFFWMVADQWPQMLNVGALITSEKFKLYFILLNNRLKIVYGATGRALLEIASTPLPYVAGPSSLRIADQNGGCMIFFGQHLLNHIPQCLDAPVEVSVFTFPNGTPGEAFAQLTSSSL